MSLRIALNRVGEKLLAVEAVKWAYLGNNYFTPLDTVETKEIRARMQSRFGPPTRTLVELDYSRGLRREEYIQFEYWFILNDSIPMMVMDVNGPFEQGIVVAGDHRYRNILYTMRQSFLGRMMHEETLAPYVDYYYNYASRRNPLDTVETKEIRARMQSRFGPPTRTLVELDYSRGLRREEYIQFEYWFILNDSIPMMVMDVNGPFEQGIVVAGDHRYRNILYTMRQSFLGRMMHEETLAPYVDYYYNYASRRWYRTGYDGQQFFTDPIGQPNLARGRPQLARPGG